MGLWRLFWIPAGAPPTDGAYVRYPTSDLLDILALESQRAGSYVVGEDLGTVEPVVGESMAARDMLSYKLVWFERVAPADYPARSLAAVTNHDLPTVAGLWSGNDLAAQRAMGLQPDEHAHAALRARIIELTGVPQDADAAEVARALYGVLAEAPSALIAATLEDALGLAERPNHPGTTHEWPNWSLPLPLALEDLEDDAAATSLAATLSSRRARSR
jgi:4-alpha-glucanotransferase